MPLFFDGWYSRKTDARTQANYYLEEGAKVLSVVRHDSVNAYGVLYTRDEPIATNHGTW
jgi:hypothetical protein